MEVFPKEKNETVSTNRSSGFYPRTYIACPKCCKSTFGVLMILKDHYCRRCRECFYPKGGQRAASFPLPELNKSVIYLDQFAISNMLALNPGAKSGSQTRLDLPFWLTLFEKLDSLCKLQLIVCPDSDFHRHESMLSAFYPPLERMYELLSGGVSSGPRNNSQVPGYGSAT
jgi:ADP-heptose:LPS heptosyltransferase